MSDQSTGNQDRDERKPDDRGSYDDEHFGGSGGLDLTSADPSGPLGPSAASVGVEARESSVGLPDIVPAIGEDELSGTSTEAPSGTDDTGAADAAPTGVAAVEAADPSGASDPSGDGVPPAQEPTQQLSGQTSGGAPVPPPAPAPAAPNQAPAAPAPAPAAPNQMPPAAAPPRPQAAAQPQPPYPPPPGYPPQQPPQPPQPGYPAQPGYPVQPGYPPPQPGYPPPAGAYPPPQPGYAPPQPGYPPQVPAPPDPHQLARVVSMLSPRSKRAGQTAWAVLATVLDEGDVVELLVQGQVRGLPGFAALVGSRIVLVNAREWKPDVLDLTIAEDLQVQGVQQGNFVALVFTRGGTQEIVDQISEGQLAVALAEQVRVRAAAQAAPAAPSGEQPAPQPGSGQVPPAPAVPPTPPPVG